MNSRDLHIAVQGLESLMLRRKSPVTVDGLEVDIEDPTGLDHTFRISTTGDPREPWLLTGVVVNGRLVKGQRCWRHFKTFADLSRILVLIRKGKATVSMNQAHCELDINLLQG